MKLELPLTLETRNGLRTRDARVVNAYAEKRGLEVSLLKRPGAVLSQANLGVTGQGLFFYNGMLYTVVDDTLYAYDPLTGGLPGGWSSSTSWLGEEDGIPGESVDPNWFPPFVPSTGWTQL